MFFFALILGSKTNGFERLNYNRWPLSRVVATLETSLFTSVFGACVLRMLCVFFFIRVLFTLLLFLLF